MKTRSLFPFLFSLFTAAMTLPASAQPLSVASPDSTLAVAFSLSDDGAPRYRLQRFGNDVVRRSRLGFALKDAPALDDGFRVTDHETSSYDETWTQPWGQQKTVRNHYNELRVQLQETSAPERTMTVVFRVFDDGLGFRYEIPEQPKLGEFEIMDEYTTFALTGNPSAWWIPAYAGNRYEYLYRHTPLAEIDTVHTPVTLETEDGLYLSLHEAALTNYAGMTLAGDGDHTLEADLVPWSDGSKVKATAPLETPWRTVLVGDTPGDLATARVMLNLNEPNKLDDLSWIEPGKYVGIWWGMHIGKYTWGKGPDHGATTENVKRYIDFAARHGFEGVLVEGWNRGWGGDWVNDSPPFQFDEPYDDFDMDELSRYAREKGVRLIGHHETGGGVENYEKQMTDAYEYAQEHGIRTVKTGYVNNGQNIRRTTAEGNTTQEWQHGQFMVRHYRRAVKEAAEHEIMLNVHEPIHGTGIRRTYPNMMTREGARGQEFSAWGSEGGNPPEHTTILPFTRLLAGPMDFTPGTFDLLFEETRPDNRINTTLAKQLALYVVLYSPWQMASDLPENYEARPEPLQFIEDVPTDWTETQVVHGRIGDYVTFARKDRNSDDWYLGSVTDERGRTLKTSLSFLEPDREYVAEIYRDADDADWKTNPQAITIEEKLVESTDAMQLRLAPGGGQAVRFRPADDEDEQRLREGR
jgi:alpha-glucosidase